MIKKLLMLTLCLGCLVACSPTSRTSEVKESNSNTAYFSWFDYAGDDEVFKQPLADDQYRNPILAGYYPDPSVVRVGEDYYMVNSTFGFFPGIPIFHSRDLVNWTQLGNVIHRPEQLSFDGIHLGYNGVYAPTIEYRDGTFYVINTCVGCGGNFVVTATDPAGPWSDPTWIPDIAGIDPSIFFDDDGKTYVVHHRDPVDKKYDAHTALWVLEVDPITFAPLSEDVMLVDGADEAPWHTEYIEGPHIYKVDGTYYLSAPGGGTGYFHGQLVYKSDNIFGPYVANPNNPILTQLGLPDDRVNPVTSTGHADMFTDSNGDWWAVFLGTRVYDLNTPPRDPSNFATGRETFMLPVTWQDGWPRILDKGQAVSYAVKKPHLAVDKIALTPLTGNYHVRDEFKNNELAPHWLMVRTPHRQWWKTANQGLSMQARSSQMGDYQQPSFVGRRLAHMKASFATKVQFNPEQQNDEAGLMALQNDDYFYAFGVGLNAKGERVLRVRKKAGSDYAKYGQVVTESKLSIKASDAVYLSMAIDKTQLNFSYSLDGKTYTTLLDNADGKVLTTAMAGGFTGAVVGMYAQGSAE